MFRFALHAPASRTSELRGAHLLGADSVPMRGQIRLVDGIAECEARGGEPTGLSLLWPVGERGAMQLETTRVPARTEPYHLPIELVRHRLMRISVKREEWGLFDYGGMDEIAERIDLAREQFIAALQATDDPRAAARLAAQALDTAVEASEQLTRFHARVFLGRRQQMNGFAQPICGAVLQRDTKPDGLRLREALDFLRLPITWREVQPKEQGFAYEAVDAWVQSAAKLGLPLRGGPLLAFGVQSVPDWLYIWENDFEAIADFVRDYVRHTVQRYAEQIGQWVICAGLHADGVFPLTFEQMIELTRLAAATARQAAPRASLVVDLSQPWGEYYARNQQTIPPALYADMLTQAGVPFDAFGVQLLMGIDSEGFHQRDLLQISALLDRLANYGRPLQISALAAPSSPSGGGEWAGPWTEATQADWLAAVWEVAMSKPFVESVCFHTLADSAAAVVPTGGLLNANLKPKAAYKRVVALRSQWRAEVAKK